MTKIKPNILEAKCIIIKIGSSLLIEKKKFNKEKIKKNNPPEMMLQWSVSKVNLHNLFSILFLG